MTPLTPGGPLPEPLQATLTRDSQLYTRAELREWMIAYLAQLLGIERSEVDPAQTFEIYGLDSSGAVGLSGDLEELLGVRFDTSLVYDYPTLDGLLEHLVERGLVRDS